MSKSGKGFGEMQFLQLPQVQVLSDLTKKNIPTAVEDEWGIFACIFNVLEAKSQFERVASILEPKHFYVEPLRDVWTAMVEAKRRRIPIEFKCILNYLQDWHSKNKDFLGSLISQLHESLHDPEYIEQYARRIVEKHDGREVLKLCANGIHSLVGDTPTSAEDTLLQIERQLRELRQQVILKKDQGSDFDVLFDNLTTELDDLSSGKAKPKVLTTDSWYDFDQACQGYAPGDFFVIGAPTGCGKSTAGISMAREFALKGNSVFYASLEMTQQTVVSRVISPLVNFPVNKLTRGMDISKNKVEEIKAVREKLRGIKLAIKKPATNSYEGFAKSLAEAEVEFKQKHGDDFEGFQVIIVDYLQLLTGNVPAQLTTIEIDRVAKNLRNLAIDNNCVVIALAQMDTETAKGGKEPNGIGCLSYCKTIDHHATQVILMWNEGFSNRQKLQQTTGIDFIWVKNRDGNNDRVRMGIDWSKGWLYSLANSSNRPYEADPASQARPVAQVPDLKFDWKGFEKFKVDDEEEVVDSSDLEIAAPKGADVVDEDLLSIVTGGKSKPDPEPIAEVQLIEPELPELAPAAKVEQELAQVADVAQDSSQEQLATTEETITVKGITYRIGEIVDHTDQGVTLKAKVIGKGTLIGGRHEGVTLEFQEGWKDYMPEINGNEWIIAPGQVQTTYTKFLTKLE